MKRIIAAVVLALLFHVVLFKLNPFWFMNARKKEKKPPSVTVTMSYKVPVKPPPVEKPAEKIRKVKEKKIKKPEKTEKKPAPVRAEKIQEIPVEPEKEEAVEETIEQEEGEAVEEAAAITEDEEEDGVPPAEGVVDEIITEAEPLYRENPEPGYPRMARKRGYQGTVLLSVLVNEKGRVENLMLFESCGYRILDNAALRAVKDWVFEPGRQGDNPVEMWVQVPVRFELK